MSSHPSSLSQQLADQQAQSRAKIPADQQTVMTKATEQLKQSGLVERSLGLGDRIPKFTLPNALNQPVRIQDVLAQGPVVISFYRGEWCPYCNLELRALQAIVPEIQEGGASLVTISPQTPDHSLSTREKNELTFEVLSDVGNGVARAFGLVFTLPEDLRPVYEGFGIDLPDHNGDRTFELPVPATYVVAPNGEIVYAFVDADYTHRAEPSDILEALKSLKVSA